MILELKVNEIKEIKRYIYIFWDLIKIKIIIRIIKEFKKWLEDDVNMVG